MSEQDGTELIGKLPLAVLSASAPNLQSLNKALKTWLHLHTESLDSIQVIKPASFVETLHPTQVCMVDTARVHPGPSSKMKDVCGSLFTGLKNILCKGPRKCSAEGLPAYCAAIIMAEGVFVAAVPRPKGRPMLEPVLLLLRLAQAGPHCIWVDEDWLLALEPDQQLAFQQALHAMRLWPRQGHACHGFIPLLPFQQLASSTAQSLSTPAPSASPASGNAHCPYVFSSSTPDEEAMRLGRLHGLYQQQYDEVLNPPLPDTEPCKNAQPADLQLPAQPAQGWAVLGLPEGELVTSFLHADIQEDFQLAGQKAAFLGTVCVEIKRKKGSCCLHVTKLAGEVRWADTERSAENVELASVELKAACWIASGQSRAALAIHVSPDSQRQLAGQLCSVRYLDPCLEELPSMQHRGGSTRAARLKAQASAEGANLGQPNAWGQRSWDLNPPSPIQERPSACLEVGHPGNKLQLQRLRSDSRLTGTPLSTLLFHCPLNPATMSASVAHPSLRDNQPIGMELSLSFDAHRISPGFGRRNRTQQSAAPRPTSPGQSAASRGFHGFLHMMRRLFRSQPPRAREFEHALQVGSPPAAERAQHTCPHPLAGIIKPLANPAHPVT